LIETNPPPYSTIRVNPAAAVAANNNKNLKRKDHLFFSIFNLICWSTFLGIPALIFSIKAREQNQLGLFKQAEDNAKTAKKLNLIGLVVGLIDFTILVIIYNHFPRK
jgi:hypothetical protein